MLIVTWAGLALVKIVRQREAPRFFRKGGHFQGFPESAVAAPQFKNFSLLAVAAMGIGWGCSSPVSPALFPKEPLIGWLL